MKRETIKATSAEQALGPNVRVRTHLGETGTVVGPHYTQKDWHHVRIDGALDQQTPPRWIGELVKCYRADELTALP